MPEKTWGPAFDTQIPEHERVPYQVLWLTSWFDHADLTKRDLNDLTYALPSTRKVPSIYTMHEHYDELVYIPPIVMGVEGKSPPGTDAMLMGLLGTPLKENYERVVFRDESKGLLPNAKVWVLGRAHSGTFSISSYWQVQAENEKRGGSVDFEMTPHNHFVSNIFVPLRQLTTHTFQSCTGTNPRLPSPLGRKHWPEHRSGRNSANSALYW